MDSEKNRPSVLAIGAHAFDDEAACIAALSTRLSHMQALEPAIMEKASRWVQDVRAQGAGHGIEAFLAAYSLATEEGVALMCLAEALLRIPDSATADRLINDTLAGKDWRRHALASDSWLVAAAGWGLLLGGKVVDFGHEPSHGVIYALHRLTARLGEPVIRQALTSAMRLIGSQFVLGETIGQALDESRAWEAQSYVFSYDMLGEGARSDAQAQAYVRSYCEAVKAVAAHAKADALFARPSISVKLSALHPRYSLTQERRVMDELLPRLKTILLLAKHHRISVSIDAEEANRLEIELMMFAKLYSDPDFAGWSGLGFVLQAYQKRAIHVVDFLKDLSRTHGRIMPVRLVKGAYWDSEIKHAQVQGLPDYPVFTRKEYTDISYLACAQALLERTDCFYPQFATHNARTIASIQEMAKAQAVARDAFEFQRLHGMGEKLHGKIARDYVSRIYAPVGAHKDLLAYLIRRLLENGASSSFVHLLLDETVTVEQLLANPLQRAKLAAEHIISKPERIYGARRNSSGADLGYHALHEGLVADHVPDVVVAEVDAAAIARMAEEAHAAFDEWSRTSTDSRCAILESIADAFEKRAPQLRALLVEEAKKTVADSIAEVREAIDFCRYYAQQARALMHASILAGPTGEANRLALHPRGVFACISPWNFPLAIFSGQVVAALVSGNCVIAKPAEQTPRIAAFAVSLMHAAGVPRHALQLAVGKGSVIGDALTSHALIAGVVFTGSVEVAHRINRTLAARDGFIVPFIAETGGQNCMVVDSSALLEQAVDDIVLSAFGSAGQRCSALRVLYVQEEVADVLIDLLAGAMRELRLGDPSQLETDVGPVIDAKAKASLEAHIAHMENEGRLIAQAELPETGGDYVAPRAFEIGSISQLHKEHFGPILHVIRFKEMDRERVANEINSTGYGLTFGMHSRVQENVDFFVSRVRAGNIYVNRSMIGAVVGVQPFGGEGLSGTGFKAGGPYYLLRFMHERSTSVNSAALGGNVSLLTGH